jgi:putative heme-binding domain-containing protein
MVLPSKVIAEGFATTEIETKSGEVVTGRVVREDDQIVVVLPQTATEATGIRKDEMRRRELSKVSNMPAGILSTLQSNQILDLLAYVISDANSNHVVFATGESGLNRREQR